MGNVAPAVERQPYNSGGPDGAGPSHDHGQEYAGDNENDYENENDPNAGAGVVL